VNIHIREGAELMKSFERLREILQSIDGKGYKAYKEIKGIYESAEFKIFIDHVQGDPFALPSRIRIRVNQKNAEYPSDTFCNKSREIALRDFITRQIHKAVIRYCKNSRGTGKSGAIIINTPGQEILERTSVIINNDFVEARILMGLPALRRKISSRDAEEMFFDELPKIITESMLFSVTDKDQLYRHIETSEDADQLRDMLSEYGLIAFIADKSILPRWSGIDPRPLRKGKIIPFESPEKLRIEINLKNRGEITGMAIPEGITLIAGGGYHGKSTLLNAVELGIYNHIPDDGREFVISDKNAVKIRAEDGRRIEKTTISPFINNLPFNQDTDQFCSNDASGSTSQSANIIESLETGAKVLMIDEDTSATNFMIRDHRMQELVSKDREPITPFIDKVKQLYNDLGISTILVIGGSGDYFDVADLVICMEEYRPRIASEEAHRIAKKYQSERKSEGGKNFGSYNSRIPFADSLNPSRGNKEINISPKGLKSISFGSQTIDLGAVEQLVDLSQTNAIGDAINYSKKYMNGKNTLNDVINHVMRDIENRGLDILSPWPVGNYAEFRGLELASAINRSRALKVKPK